MENKSPGIEGNLEISSNPDGIFIGGDPDGLRSLAKLLCWIADFDQEKSPFPDGDRHHVHLHRYVSEEFTGSLKQFSEETELCRLDAKGSGDFPEKYARAEVRLTKQGREEELAKLKCLRELELKDIESPDYAFLEYAVCACDVEPCGWGGWVLGSAFKITEKKHPTGTGDKALPAKMDRTCPACGKTLYSTAKIRLERSSSNIAGSRPGLQIEH